jgi:hypothetical protein
MSVAVTEKPSAANEHATALPMPLAAHALSQEDVKVPDDIALVGYDDIPVAARLDPPLTTVVQPKKDQARLAHGRSGLPGAAGPRHLTGERHRQLGLSTCH